MAQKKGLIYRLTMGKDNLPDFTPDKLPGTRLAQFKDIFFGRLGALVKINLLVILFCLPAIAWILICYMIKLSYGATLPYSGNIGIGYPGASDVVAASQSLNFMLQMQQYLVLIPCIMVASIGLSGAFYVMRRLVWGEGITVVGHFFHGIKKNFLPFLWSSLFCGIALFLVMINISIYNRFTDVHLVWRIIGIAISVLTFVIVICMMMFLSTQAVTYKLKTWALIKNSFLFSIALLPTNLIILVLCAIPVVLLVLLSQIPLIMMFAFMVFALLGFSFIILMWTVYGHWAFDKFLNDRVEGAVKNRGMYTKTAEDVRASDERKNKNTRFNNPKKRAKKIVSIDEGETYTPLPSSFSRADLARLEVEKEVVKRSIDAEYEDGVEPTDEHEPQPLQDGTENHEIDYENEDLTEVIELKEGANQASKIQAKTANNSKKLKRRG